LKKSPIYAAGINGRANNGAGNGQEDGLLRPEPKLEEPGSTQGGLALLGLTFAGLALIAIYISTPIDSPEWPDCPIQALGSCGEK
jgi:hypothetical protein